MSHTTRDPYEEAKKQLKEAIEILGLSDEVYEVLAVPERLIRVSIPVKMDDGTVKVFTGWRSQHNSALGPYKGGIRYHPDVHEHEVIALSMWMSWKNSLAQLPYGGGKGGIKVDPHKLSPGELERLSRKYFEMISKVVGIDEDIPAPDVYTNPQTMAWYMDEYSRLKGFHAFGVVTGKPLLLGGLYTRVISTGHGTAVTAAEAAKKVLGGIEGKTVAIQGFGNAGQFAAKSLAEMGAIIVAVSDSKGGVFNSKGLDVEKLIEVKQKTGSVINYPDVEKKIGSKDPLFLDVDVLIPAALENQITAENADKVKARVIAEAANGPTTPDGEEILTKKGIVVVPDILANAGGVIVSHIEWVNNRMGGWLKEEEVKARLEEKMTNNFHAVWDFWQNKLDTSKYNMRAAAYALAVKRVYDAMKLRGRI